MVITILILFLLIVIFLESRSKNWIVSPIILLSLPTSTLIFVHILLRPYTNFIPFSDFAILITLYGFICFWIGSISYRVYERNLPYRKHTVEKELNNTSFTKYILVITIICIIGMLGDLKSILGQRSVMMLEDQEFANNGVSAHLGNYITISIIFLFGCIFIKDWNVKRKFAILLILTCLFLKFLTAVKGYLLLPIIGGVIFLIRYNKIHLNFKSFSIIGACSMTLFILMGAFFNVDSEKNEIGLDFLLNFFSFYLFSGLTGLSGNLANDHLRFGLFPEWIVSFFTNFYEKFLGSGNLYDGGAFSWVRVTEYNALIQHDSNVCTLIGEVYINCGYLLGSLILFVLGWYSTFLFQKSKNNYLYGLIYSYVGACIFFNFFSTYIRQPGFYESQFFCIIIILLSQYKFVIRPKHISVI